MYDAHFIETRPAADDSPTGQKASRVEVLSLVVFRLLVPVRRSRDGDGLDRLHVGLLAEGVGDVTTGQVLVHLRRGIWSQATDIPNQQRQKMNSLPQTGVSRTLLRSHNI